MNIISENVKIGNNFKIGYFNVISDNVIIGDNVEIGNNVRIDTNTIIGDNVRISDGAIIGGEPQERRFDGINDGKVIIGNNTIIREYVTVNKNFVKGGSTIIGKNCLILAYSHVSHDTIIEDKVTITNLVQIGGHSIIQEGANIGGGALIHQRSTIGMYSMVAADSFIVKDVTPYSLVGGSPVSYKKLNLVGLKRYGFTNEQIKNIDDCYRTIFKSGKNITNSINELLKNSLNKEQETIITFIKNSKRGIYKI